MKPPSLTRLLFAALLLQVACDCAHAQTAATSAKFGFSGVAAAGAAVVFANSKSTVNSMAKTGPLPAGGAAGIAGAAATNGSSQNSGGAGFGVTIVGGGSPTTLIAIITSGTANIVSSGTSP
jgi:hypothetical protein